MKPFHREISDVILFAIFLLTFQVNLMLLIIFVFLAAAVCVYCSLNKMVYKIKRYTTFQTVFLQCFSVLLQSAINVQYFNIFRINSMKLWLVFTDIYYMLFVYPGVFNAGRITE